MYIAAKVVIFFGFLPHLMDKSQTNAKRTLEFAISCILFLFCFLLFPSLFLLLPGPFSSPVRKNIFPNRLKILSPRFPSRIPIPPINPTNPISPPIY